MKWSAPQDKCVNRPRQFKSDILHQTSAIGFATYDIVQKVSVFVHPTGHFCAKPFTSKGLIVGIAVENKVRQASVCKDLAIELKAKN